MTSEIETVQAWQAAANDQDIERLLALSAPDIALIGPRGRGSGHDLLREWVARAGLTLTTRRIFQRGDAVVLAQRGRWRTAAGDDAGNAEVATRFRVRGGRVAELERYDDLDHALAAAELSAADERAPAAE